MIEIISATRLSERDFWNTAALGLSLRRLAEDRRLMPRLTFLNQRGLPELFNARISASDGPDVVVFMHDDIWIDDFFFADRVMEGLAKFDVIGITGNRRRYPRQPSWAFVDDKFKWDDKTNLSGSLAHGPHPFGVVSIYGPAPQECELLDGIFLAAKRSVLRQQGVLFDPRFDFHFYDLDFCRTARERGLHLGTWPICLTHQSGGGLGTDKWLQKYHLYIEKWSS